MKLWYALADIDECEDEPCLNGGTCVGGINTYTCQCNEGWTGKDCWSSMWL